jgi:hypothetical protein
MEVETKILGHLDGASKWREPSPPMDYRMAKAATLSAEQRVRQVEAWIQSFKKETLAHLGLGLQSGVTDDMWRILSGIGGGAEWCRERTWERRCIGKLVPSHSTGIASVVLIGHHRQVKLRLASTHFADGLWRTFRRYLEKEGGDLMADGPLPAIRSEVRQYLKAACSINQACILTKNSPWSKTCCNEYPKRLEKTTANKISCDLRLPLRH